MTLPDWAALDAAWEPARRAGVLGSTTTEEIIAHAAGYVPAACRVDDEFLGVDLGTGAGVPGVVLAALRPRSRWVLIDGNERRVEYARTAARALDLEDRVEVRHVRAEELADDTTMRGRVDLLVARSFGDPAELAECGLPLLATSGVLSVSVTDATAARWQAAVGDLPIAVASVESTADGRYLQVRRTDEVPANWPRRPAARRRSPVL